MKESLFLPCVHADFPDCYLVDFSKYCESFSSVVHGTDPSLVLLLVYIFTYPMTSLPTVLCSRILMCYTGCLNIQFIPSLKKKIGDLSFNWIGCYWELSVPLCKSHERRTLNYKAVKPYLAGDGSGNKFRHYYEYFGAEFSRIRLISVWNRWLFCERCRAWFAGIADVLHNR